MALNLKNGKYLSLKGTQHKIAFLDKSDFEDFLTGIVLIATPVAGKLPKLRLVPYAINLVFSQEETAFYLPQKDFEELSKKILDSKRKVGLAAYYIKDGNTDGVLWHGISIEGFDHDSVGPIIKLPPPPPRPQVNIGIRGFRDVS